MRIHSQKYRRAKLDELTPHPENPRQGDIGAIHQSIEANGFYGALITQKSTGYVLAGSHRLVAAQQAGSATVPILELDVDDETALRILLADNRTNDLATYDRELLASILVRQAQTGIEGLVGTGYDGDDLDDILRTNAAMAIPVDPAEEWKNMPEFKQEDLNSVFSCVVHFRTPDDAEAFFVAINRPKRKSFWWPQDDGHVGSYLGQQDVSE